MNSNSEFDRAVQDLQGGFNQAPNDMRANRPIAASNTTTPPTFGGVLEGALPSDIDAILGLDNVLNDPADIYANSTPSNPSIEDAPVPEPTIVDVTQLPQNSAVQPGVPTSNVHAVTTDEWPLEPVTDVQENSLVIDGPALVVQIDEDDLVSSSTEATVIVPDVAEEKPVQEGISADLFEQLQVIIRRDAETVLAGAILNADQNHGQMTEDTLYETTKALRELNELSGLIESINFQTQPLSEIPDMFDPRSKNFEPTIAPVSVALPPESEDPDWKTRWEDWRDILDKKQIDEYKAQVNVTSLRKYDDQRRVLYAIEAELGAGVPAE